MQPDRPFDNLPADALRLLQISDPHIFSKAGGRLLGVDTRASLSQVIDQVNASVEQLDAILLTGDIVHDEGRAGYTEVRRMLARLSAPVYCLPGNHDEKTRLKLLDGGNAHIDKKFVLGDWLVLMLDSVIAGDEAGRLSAAELAFVDRELAAHPKHNALICLHHHPLPIGCQWLDAIRLRNGDELFAVLDRHDNARGVLWGHIHQVFDGWRNRVRLLGSPSTCIQFMPGTDDFEIDVQPPGYRWLGLLPDGDIRTQVNRVEHVSTTLEVGSGGY
jgi:Icc protein